ncbi:Hypothetical protein MexAM1_META1p2193 [Methylorubrum extorquens AM1]|uniref:Uncharacterized protein n=1 Tax=Methylorubrum extorquens (strain ATCC 14718 / DSM 1338 / JCM 2805 / NCIMB 9133 / AM1) TaxID=272630 RepID=C5APV2_METEA|nr:Hypothetical protein MexAM1_META1p2193 [Methylorubrum extorquens AM1]
MSLVLAGATRLQSNGADPIVEWTRREGAPNPEVTASGAKNVIKRKPNGASLQKPQGGDRSRLSAPSPLSAVIPVKRGLPPAHPFQEPTR